MCRHARFCQPVHIYICMYTYMCLCVWSCAQVRSASGLARASGEAKALSEKDKGDCEEEPSLCVAVLSCQTGAQLRTSPLPPRVIVATQTQDIHE